MQVDAIISKVGITEDPLQRVYAAATKIHSELKKLGIPDPGASFATYQTYFETGAYTNKGWNEYNNASGIKFAGQRNAVKTNNGYAKFNTLADWARSFKHEITKKSNPAAAKTIEDYNKRLIANRYYEANPDQYLAGLKRARYVLKSLPASERAGVDKSGNWQDKRDMDIPGSKSYPNTPGSADYNKYDPKNWPQWLQIAAAATAGIIIIKTVGK